MCEGEFQYIKLVLELEYIKQLTMNWTVLSGTESHPATAPAYRRVES